MVFDVLISQKKVVSHFIKKELYIDFGEFSPNKIFDLTSHTFI